MTTRWTMVGPRPAQPRPSYAAAALALVFAMQTFLPVTERYPLYMVVFAFLGSGWLCYLGIRRRALMALLLVPVCLVWLAPLVGSDWFSQEGPRFFLAHAALAMLFGTAAYTYAATEKH